ncbi:MAG: endonuclease/exonuclease/phosphatase family protein, partial [Telluria sp.]
MLVVTYNINGMNARLSALLEYLEERKPDVVCLQELKAPQEKFPEQAILDAGYHALWHGQKSWNGVAILTRDGPAQELQRGLPGDP